MLSVFTIFSFKYLQGYRQVLWLERKSKKAQRLQVYNEILGKYNSQPTTVYEISELPLSNVTLSKSNVRLSTVQYGKSDNIIVGFDEVGIQEILLKNNADLNFVEFSLSSLFDSDITIKDGEIIGISKFVRGTDYPNNISEYYIPIVTEEINYYPDNIIENWQNDFLDATTESSVNNVTDNEWFFQKCSII